MKNEKQKINDLIGAEVQLFPNDTYKKHAILRKIDKYGFYFEITKSRDEDFIVGCSYFYSHSCKINFKFS